MTAYETVAEIETQRDPLMFAQKNKDKNSIFSDAILWSNKTKLNLFWFEDIQQV